jgi:hypothetical protein
VHRYGFREGVHQLAAAAPVDLLVDIAGYRVERFAGVFEDRVVMLRDTPSFVLLLTPWSDLPAGITATVSFDPSAGPESSFWPHDEQEPRPVPGSGRVPVALRHLPGAEIALTLHNPAGRSRRVSLTVQDLSELMDGDVVEVPVDAAALAAALARLKQ